jgi:TetR/AcrR family transcriptional regulator
MDTGKVRVIRKEKKSTGEIARKRKQVILHAAESAFAQNGFNGTSIQMVAELAKLPKTNILYYFKSKSTLYSAVIRGILHTWNSSFDQVTINDDPSEALAQYIAEKIEISRTNPNASKIFGLEILKGAHNFDENFKKQHKKWFEGRVAVINGWINEGKMPEISAEYLLFNIWASTQHYADFSAQIKDLRGSKMTKKDFLLATKTVVSLILKGAGLVVPERFSNAS